MKEELRRPLIRASREEKPCPGSRHSKPIALSLAKAESVFASRISPDATIERSSATENARASVIASDASG